MMKTAVMNYLIVFYICILFSFISVSAQREQHCQGLEILYPKTDTIIDKTLEGQTTYLILGNTASTSKNNVLKEVLLLRVGQQEEVSKKQVWIGQDEVVKVSAIQQDLNKLLSSDNTYWFRASIEQDGIQCQLVSGRFRIK